MRDLSYALRTLRNSPVFTAVAVCSLALGIGANTAIFSLIDAILLRSLPVKNPAELAVVGRNPGNLDTSFNYPDYLYVRDHNQTFSGVIAASDDGQPTSFQIPGAGESRGQLISLSMVSGNYFDVLGVTPAIGRMLNPADNEKEGAHPFAVLGYAFWERAFGGDTAIIGRDILLNGSRFQVVGVAREGFRGTSVGNSPDVFVPVMMNGIFNPGATMWNSRRYWWLTVMGRLKPGVSMNQAASEMDVLWKQILEADPGKRPKQAWDKEFELRNRMTAEPGAQGYSNLRNRTSKPLVVLMITVALVLVVACANVANLLLARSASRRREIAVRLAIGASRTRLLTQLLTESVVLALMGGVAGMAFAWGGIRLLLGFLPADAFPVELGLSPDLRLLGFALGLSLLTGLIFGLAPAVRASRPDLVPALKTDAGSTQGGRPSRFSLQRLLVSFQVCLSLVLLAGAGLFVRSLGNLRDLDPGMNRENLLLVNTNTGQQSWQQQRERDFYQKVSEMLQRAPGVRSVAIAAITPLAGMRWNSNVQIEGYTWKQDERPVMDMNGVTPRYFETAGIPIVLGRDFAESDNVAVLPDRAPGPPSNTAVIPGPPPVVIVNEAFVRRFFAGQSPIGKRVVMDQKWDASKSAEIVGVVRDARYFNLRKAVEPMLYQPKYRHPGGAGFSTLCVRYAANSGGDIAGAVRRAMAQVDSSIAVTTTRTMEENLNRHLLQERFIATLGGFFGVVALLLAAVGLYGVMSQNVTRRTREIGIRMALGAEVRALLWLVMKEALMMVVIGGIAGAGVALMVTRYAESMLFGLKAQDPATLTSAAAILFAVTALAGLIPAVRAARVQPLVALREE